MPPKTVTIPLEEPAGSGYRTGTVGIVGRPNVGKSTLLNRLVGQKISITSRKAQTTRHRIRGIFSDSKSQFIFVDTPGFQRVHKNALNRSMNRAVHAALAGVDVVLVVLEAGKFAQADRAVIDLLSPATPAVLVLNKADLVKDKDTLLPYFASRASEYDYGAIIPVSAKTGLNRDELLAVIRQYLPLQPPIFATDELTDHNERFLASELIREKVFRLVGDELPYGCTVTIERFEEEPAQHLPGHRFCRIYATILVGRASHKAMLIGAAGAKLKQIGTEARQDIEKLLDARVHLELWIKVKSGWADNEATLKSYGYD